MGSNNTAKKAGKEDCGQFKSLKISQQDIHHPYSSQANLHSPALIPPAKRATSSLAKAEFREESEILELQDGHNKSPETRPTKKNLLY